MGTRLDGWKDIAGYLGRNVRTAQRWHSERGMPVRRVPSGRSGPGSVFALTQELDEWLASPRAAGRDDERDDAADPRLPTPAPDGSRRTRWPIIVAFLFGVLLGQLWPCWWNAVGCGGRRAAAVPATGN